MGVKYSKKALVTLVKLLKFIEKKNTPGAGLRWVEKYNAFIKEKFERAEGIKLCNNESFYRRQLRCIYYNYWVIAFSYGKDTIVIKALMHKSKITN